MTTRLLWRALCLLALLCTLSHCSSATNHPDPSATEQGVTFSHVYKIDIPGSSSCKLESVPMQDNTGLQTETTANGENDIIFKHNIRLQTPKCDCEESESFKSLLYRVNGLEEEVNYLKTQCSQGCCGKGGAAGVDTSCSGHGSYQHDTCSCLCNPGWEGPDCSISSCPDECNDNGRCVDGKCVCHQGYTGDDCSQLMCPDNCNDKGQCVDGKCVCFPHFTGEDCSIQKCPNDCISNGQCVDGQCICDEGFYGEDCSLGNRILLNSIKPYFLLCLCPPPSLVLGPQGLRLVQVTDVSLLVEWEHVRGAEYYVLTYHPKYDEGAQEQVRIPNTENSYLITGLVPGVTYIVQVYAVIKEIQSEADKIEATTGKCRQLKNNIFKDRIELVKKSVKVRLSILTFLVVSADIDSPTNLVATEVTEDTATVSWDPVQAQIEGYMLSYTSAEGSSSDIPVGRDSTSYRLVGLRPGVLHTVYIWAYRGDKVSRKSSTEAETELDAPTNFLAQDETESSLMVYWDRPQAEIDGYILTYSSTEGSSEEILVGSDSTSYMLTGLRPGVLYTVYILAFKGSKASTKISTQAETEMDAPANLLARDETESSFSVSWDPVQAEIDGYILTYTSSDGSSGEIPVGPDRTSYLLTGLRPGALYTVYIWAVKGSKATRKISTQAETGVKHTFLLSQISIFMVRSVYVIIIFPYLLTVMLLVLVATSEMDAPANLLARDETESSFSVSWDPVQAEINGYILTYSSFEGSSEEIPIGSDRTSYMLSSLRPGVLYTVYVWAVKGSKATRKISTQAETEIDSPKDLKATDVTLDSASLTWIPPLADIEGYILTYRDEEGNMEVLNTHFLTQTHTHHTTSYTFSGMTGNKRSKVVETIFKTVGVLYPFPMDCVQIMKNGNKKSGVYTIYIANDRSKPAEVFCDMDTDGGGWLVLQRRNIGKLDFMKRWRQYIAGFGNLTEEFWIGLDKIYELTNTPTQYELRFDLGLGSERAYAVYDNFKIAPVKQKFKLTIGKYSGTAGDAMTYHQGRPWTTIDSDNDIALGNCALTHRGAWWYKNCHLANLNGKWGDNRHSMGVNWEPWKGHLTSIDFTEMKIRPLGALSSRKRRSLMAREKSRKTNLQKK
uniref:Tenascin N n=1 Tax=Amphiprion ocellaris TaxID=80972 RepID=A0AAQ5Y6B0_AMPOC